MNENGSSIPPRTVHGIVPTKAGNGACSSTRTTNTKSHHDPGVLRCIQLRDSHRPQCDLASAQHSESSNRPSDPIRTKWFCCCVAAISRLTFSTSSNFRHPRPFSTTKHLQAARTNLQAPSVRSKSLCRAPPRSYRIQPLGHTPLTESAISSASQDMTSSTPVHKLSSSVCCSEGTVVRCEEEDPTVSLEMESGVPPSHLELES